MLRSHLDASEKLLLKHGRHLGMTEAVALLRDAAEQARHQAREGGRDDDPEAPGRHHRRDLLPEPERAGYITKG
ncbi:hypothetical protein [Variovorax rhizosphaerae]|uniref:Uncharacterized protein n=1 Tax=Variovorax rhizosphaerae TaxID=1836200 RepID=A0ABU8WK30_9BURK